MNWTDWDGSDRLPTGINPTDRVFVVWRDGTESKVRIAGELRWRHDALADDIMRYRYSHSEPGSG
jgi:hypothetical protein